MNDQLLAAVALGDEIQRFGSYFGYASIVGLGVLSLLYFAQAREVKRLREWAGRAPERDAELAQRVQSDAQKRVVAQPIATPAAVPAQPASPQTPAAQSADAARKAAAAAVIEKFQQPGSVPGAAAAGTAPAVGPPGSLTRAAPGAATGSAAAPAIAGTPAATPGAPGATDGSGADAPSLPASVPAPAPGSVEAANASSGGSAPSAPAADAPTSAPVPSNPSNPSGMSAGTAGALAAARQAAAPARSSAYANGAGGQDTHESDAARPEPMPDLPPRRPRAEAASDERGRSRGRVGAIIAGGVAVLVAGVVLVLVLTGGSDDPPANNQIGDASPPAAAPPPPPAQAALSKADRAATPVTVLNGTTQTGLASAVARTIEKDGFTILATETNADQQIAKTTVSYATGSERAARAIARIMKVPPSAVRPVDANTSVAASPEAKIVVLVGSDKSGAG